MPSLYLSYKHCWIIIMRQNAKILNKLPGQVLNWLNHRHCAGLWIWVNFRPKIGANQPNRSKSEHFWPFCPNFVFCCHLVCNHCALSDCHPYLPLCSGTCLVDDSQPDWSNLPGGIFFHNLSYFFKLLKLIAWIPPWGLWDQMCI